MRLLRHLGPHILDFAHRFDVIIHQFVDDYNDIPIPAFMLLGFCTTLVKEKNVNGQIEWLSCLANVKAALQ